MQKLQKIKAKVVNFLKLCLNLNALTLNIVQYASNFFEDLPTWHTFQKHA